MEYAVEFWSPHPAKDIARLFAQSKATKMISSFSNKPYDGGFTSPKMVSLQKRHLGEKLIECFKIFNGFTKVDKSILFIIDGTIQTRNDGTKLKCKQINSGCTKFFFSPTSYRENVKSCHLHWSSSARLI